MRRKRGYTLTEIMVVLTILTVMIGLAVPSYFSTVEQTRINEAITNINIIHMGQKIYRLNNPTFWSGGFNATAANINAALNVDITMQYYSDIDFSAVSATGYTVRLNRSPTPPGNSAWFRQYLWNDTTKTPTPTQNP